jgi:hypothetical protein
MDIDDTADQLLNNIQLQISIEHIPFESIRSNQTVISALQNLVTRAYTQMLVSDVSDPAGSFNGSVGQDAERPNYLCLHQNLRPITIPMNICANIRITKQKCMQENYMPSRMAIKTKQKI